MIYKTDKSEILDFLQDASNYKGDCEGVYFPVNEEELVSILKKCNEEKVHLTVSGNGTGLSGGRVPADGAVVSTSLLNKILEINEAEMYAVLQPGVLLSDFQQAVESKGLFYPPDPTERNCFMGATVANNSSGAKTFKYGPTRNYVLGIRVILPSGEIVSIKRGETCARDYKLNLVTETGQTIYLKVPQYDMPKTKNSAGYFSKPGIDAIDLFIGSEGTLGIITEIKLKLIPLPENVLSAIIFFENEDNALNFIVDVRDKSIENHKHNNDMSINALGIEFFDSKSLKFLEDDYPQIPVNAGAAVWFEQQITSVSEEQVLNEWLEQIEKYNGDIESAWIATSDADRNKFKDFRHEIAWKVTEYFARENVRKVGTDTAVPNPEFIKYYKYSVNLVTENGLNYVCYGHAGNSHLHLNMLPKNEAEYNKARAIYEQLCTKAVELKGTISAEHGIGKLKRSYLKLMFTENEIKQMAELKKQLDPNLVLGIGNIIDPVYFENS
jgi:D-lactate dehydrogenase (cytochrome)